MLFFYFHLLLELATVDDVDLGKGSTRAGAVLLEKLEDLLTLRDLAKDGVGTVQPGCVVEGDEELRAVGVLGERVSEPFSLLITHAFHSVLRDPRWPWKGHPCQCASG